MSESVARRRKAARLGALTRRAGAVACALLSIMACAPLHAEEPQKRKPDEQAQKGKPAAEPQAPAAPQSFTVISPVFSQLVMFTQPASFVAAFERAGDESYIREAVPKGETVERWTQMITVTGRKGLSANSPMRPQGFIESIAGGFKRACPESFAAKALGDGRLDVHPIYVAVASCGKLANGGEAYSETALLIAIKGAADYYTIQWAERGAASAEPLVIDEEKWKSRLTALSPMRLCETVPGEKEPYPSCVNRK